ncbi:MAG: hypothetical protein HBSAPP03_08670 [Phycisphaerae bacterium]|nr:MAG: hypothetical protein HBSAPP03_08670 [Phycisphaerae bacterium]
MARREQPNRVLERLRRYRASRGRDMTISGELDRLTRGVQKQRRAAGGIESAWQELAPRVGEAAIGEVLSLSPGGVLVVRVPDASVRYEVDRWLRSGGLDALRSRCTAPLRRVRLDLGSV